MTTATRLALPAALTTLAAVALTGCVPNATDSDEAIAVVSTDDACNVATTEAPSGTVVFSVSNKGSKVTEFYLLADDQLRIISEVENIAPGVTRDLLVQVPAGTYYTVCKPGMVGSGIAAPFTVTDSGTTIDYGDHAQMLQTASAQYVAYVRDQVTQLVDLTDQFAQAYLAGDDDAARALYPQARLHWERIEPVAEAFGDLDPMMDAREVDLEEGEEWTGWHHLEKNLWPEDADGGVYDLTDDQKSALVTKLLADTAELSARVNAADFTFEPFQIGNGAKALLDEVASGKVTGEEEAWSHTDLWDFQGNVDGARIAFEVLQPVVSDKDPDLVTTLRDRFASLDALLATYGSVDSGFVSYTDLSDAQVKELADAVDALAEPVSQLTAALVS